MGKRENLITFLSLGSLALISLSKFSDKTKKEVRKKQRGKCPITGDKIQTFHHRTPRYAGGKDTVQNALGCSYPGHALTHALRASRIHERNGPRRHIMHELSAARAMESNMTPREKEKYRGMLQQRGINPRVIRRKYRKG